MGEIRGGQCLNGEEKSRREGEEKRGKRRREAGEGEKSWENTLEGTRRRGGMVSGVWPLVSGLLSVVSDLWLLACGQWPLVYGLWPLASGVWIVDCRLYFFVPEGQ